MFYSIYYINFIDEFSVRNCLWGCRYAVFNFWLLEKWESLMVVLRYKGFEKWSYGGDK